MVRPLEELADLEPVMDEEETAVAVLDEKVEGVTVATEDEVGAVLDETEVE